MSTDEIISQLEADLARARADKVAAFESNLRRKDALEVAKLRLKYQHTASCGRSKIGRKPKSPNEKYASKNAEKLWPEAIELLRVQEVDWQKASEFLGFDLECQNCADPIEAQRVRLRRLLSAGYIKAGKSTKTRARNTYDTVSLVEFVRHGEDVIRDAKAKEKQGRDMDAQR